MAIGVMTIPIQWLFAWIVSVTIHELGHLIALKLCGVTVDSISLGWFGARIRSAYIVEKEWLCAIAGPCAGILLISFSRCFPRVAICALFHAVFNLLPVYPLDGGRFVRGILELLLPYKCAHWIAGVVGLGAVGIIGLLLVHILRGVS